LPERSAWLDGKRSGHKLPHIPGHELTGVLVEGGSNVRKWRRGDRVTVPFVWGGGHGAQCLSGNHQVCDYQFQPGFTSWGAFAETVAIDHADMNLVCLPDEIDFVSGASLGCHLVTAFRAVVDQGKLARTNLWRSTDVAAWDFQR
jgi:alcohol dehydrogenase